MLALSFQQPHNLYIEVTFTAPPLDLMTAATPSETKPEARGLDPGDEANIVELLSVSLKFQGFEVYPATNGAQALDRAREARSDAVILDVMMPGMDGFGRRAACAPTASTPPRRCSCWGLGGQDRPPDQGGDDYVTKPFSLEEVVARLRVSSSSSMSAKVRRALRGSAPPLPARRRMTRNRATTSSRLNGLVT